MRALLCDQIPVQKQVRLHATHAQKVRNNKIPLRTLEANLYVPFSMRRMRNLFSVDLQTEGKRVPDNARTGTKVTKTGHFGKLRIWGFKINAPMGITMRRQILWAHSL